MQPTSVVAIDPGSDKCGVACVASDGSLIARGIVAPESVVEWVRLMMADHQVSVVLGDGTGHRTVAAMLHEAGIAFRLVNERNTSALARRRYLEAHPPHGWRRLIPIGLRTPDRPYDDWVAVLLAERIVTCDDA